MKIYFLRNEQPMIRESINDKRGNTVIDVNPEQEGDTVITQEQYDELMQEKQDAYNDNKESMKQLRANQSSLKNQAMAKLITLGLTQEEIIALLS